MFDKEAYWKARNNTAVVELKKAVDIIKYVVVKIPNKPEDEVKEVARYDTLDEAKKACKKKQEVRALVRKPLRYPEKPQLVVREWPSGINPFRSDGKGNYVGVRALTYKPVGVKS